MEINFLTCANPGSGALGAAPAAPRRRSRSSPAPRAQLPARTRAAPPPDRPVPRRPCRTSTRPRRSWGRARCSGASARTPSSGPATSWRRSLASSRPLAFSDPGPTPRSPLGSPSRLVGLDSEHDRDTDPAAAEEHEEDLNEADLEAAIEQHREELARRGSTRNAGVSARGFAPWSASCSSWSSGGLRSTGCSTGDAIRTGSAAEVPPLARRPAAQWRAVRVRPVARRDRASLAPRGGQGDRGRSDMTDGGTSKRLDELTCPECARGFWATSQPPAADPRRGGQFLGARFAHPRHATGRFRNLAIVSGSRRDGREQLAPSQGSRTVGLDLLEEFLFLSGELFVGQNSLVVKRAQRFERLEHLVT